MATSGDEIPDTPTEIHAMVLPHESPEAELRVVVSRIHYFSSGIPPRDEVTHYLSRRCAPRDLLDHEVAKSTISSLLSGIDHPVRDELLFWRDSICSVAEDAAVQTHESGGNSFKIFAKIKIFRTDELVGPNQRPVPWRLFPPADESDNFQMFFVDGGVFGGFSAVPPMRASPTQKLEKVKFIGSHQSMTAECVICMDDFERGSELAKMPCSHLFHETCLARWLERSRACPLCRFSLPT